MNMEIPTLRILLVMRFAQMLCHTMRKLLPHCNGEWLVNAQNFGKMRGALNNIYVSYGVPYNLREDLTVAVRCMLTEYTKWIERHSETFTNEWYIFHCGKPNTILFKYLKFDLNWSINENKTAHEIVDNSEICIKKRFIMACEFCFKNEIHSLWQKLSDSEKKSLQIISNSNPITLHWYSICEKNSWNDTLIRFENDFFLKLKWAYLNNANALNFLYTQLNPDDQERCLRLVVEGFSMEPTILDFEAFNQNANFRKDMVKKCLGRTILSYLNRQHQEKIIPLADEVFTEITKRQFHEVVDAINFKKLPGDWGDFDYKSVILHFWEKTSPSVKMEIIKSRRYRGLNLGFFISHKSNGEIVDGRKRITRTCGCMDRYEPRHTSTNYSFLTSFAHFICFLCFAAFMIYLKPAEIFLKMSRNI